jgi:hypothetical protein
MRAEVAILAIFAMGASTPAWSQAAPNYRAEPWRGPADLPGTKAGDNRARVTSDEAATQPTPAEQNEARALAAAVFAKPAAAKLAADNVAPAAAPDWSTVTPRAEWTSPPGFAPGGKGVKITSPF